MENEIFKAIGNTTRLKILACLGESDKAVSELICTCELSQSAVSQHLMYLKDLKLIEAKKVGRNQIYSIKDKRLAKISKDILELMPNVKKCI